MTTPGANGLIAQQPTLAPRASRRRVLHCVPGMGGGGAERQLAYLARELPSYGWEVHVALISGGPNAESLAVGAHIHWLRASGNHDPRLLPQLIRLIRRTGCQLVQSWMTQMDVLGGLAARRTGLPWILTERSSAAAYPPTFKHLLRRYLAQHASLVISNSEGGDDYWRLQLGERVPRVVIPNGIPFREIQAARPALRTEWDLCPGERLVLYAGRLSEEKNLRTLIPALRSVVAEPGNVAVLCGDGPHRSAVLDALSAELADGRVRVPGYVDALWPLLKIADVFVSLARFEGNPNAVLEAVACGCPLVLSDIPAHRELLDDDCATFVDANDSEGAARAIKNLLAAPGSARAQSAAAATRLTSRTTTAMARAYSAAYERALAPARKHPLSAVG